MVWNFGTFKIHSNPTMNVVDGAIDFDAGSYSFSIVLQGGSSTHYGYTLTLELHKGVPDANTRVATLATWEGALNPNPHTEYFSGSGLTLGDGDYYIMMRCNSSSGCSHVTSPSNGWVQSPISTSGAYAAYKKITTVGDSSSGSISISAYTTGKTIVVTPIHSPSGKSITDMNGNAGKISVTIGSTTKSVDDGGSVTFDGLNNGANYTVTCQCKEGNKTITATSVETTFKTTVTVVDKTNTSVAVKIHVNNGYEGVIVYGLGEAALTSQTRNDRTVSITVPAGAESIIYASPQGMLDAIGNSSVTTEEEQPDTVTSVMTGTTVTMKPSFNKPNLNWKATIGNQTVSGTGNNAEAKFSQLYNGNTYTAVFRDAAFSSTSVASGDAVNLFILQNGDKVSELKYNVRTYACILKEDSCMTNEYIADIYQTRGALGPANGTMTESPAYPYDCYCTLRNGNVANGEPVGLANIVGEKCYVRSLEPNTSYRLYVWLKGCKDFNGNNDAVGYIDFTTKPAAVAGSFSAHVTGTTCTITPAITRWNGSTTFNYRCEFFEGGKAGTSVGTVSGTCDLSSIEEVTKMALKTGTKYWVAIRAFDDNGNEVECNDIEIVTYGLRLSAGNPHTTFMDGFSVQYIDGERSSTVSQDASRGANIKWYITDEYESMVDGIGSINCRRTNPAFESTNPVLGPSNTYTLYAYIDGVVYEGNNDTVVSISFTTVRAARNLYVETQATGETIGVTTYWDSPNIDGYDLTVNMVLTLDGVIKGTKENSEWGEAIWFTGLERGKTYTITYTARDNEGNTTNDYINYAVGYTSVMAETTYKLTIANFSHSTRSITWKCTCNRTKPDSSNVSVEYYIAQPDAVKVEWGLMSVNTTYMYTALQHNINVTLSVRIKDMRNLNGDYDTVETITVRMKKLSVNLADYHAHVRIIDTKWQAYADADRYDLDPISGTKIQFVENLCTCVPVIPNKGSFSSSDGIYYNDDDPENVIIGVRYFRGLTGGREYSIRVGITDGFNTVQSPVNNQIMALLQAIRIYDEEMHDWRLAVPYLYHSGMWWKAPVFMYGRKEDDGELEWLDSDPETNDDHL